MPDADVPQGPPTSYDRMVRLEQRLQACRDDFPISALMAVTIYVRHGESVADAIDRDQGRAASSSGSAVYAETARVGVRV